MNKSDYYNHDINDLYSYTSFMHVNEKSQVPFTRQNIEVAKNAIYVHI
jgi:hypothetical protein